jgi:hypothetical protein
LNKIIYRARIQKGRHAIKFIILICLASIAISWQQTDDDYIILNQLLEQVKGRKPDWNIRLKANRNNSYVAAFMKELKDTEATKNQDDGLRQGNMIKQDSVFDKVFNNSQYDYLISQKDTTNWDFNKITVAGIKKLEEKKFVDKDWSLVISKPIYTADHKFALVYVLQGGADMIIIYRKQNDKWIDYKVVAYHFVTRKAIYRKRE